MTLKDKIKIVLGLFVGLNFGEYTLGQVPEEIEPFMAPFGEFNFQRPQFRDTTVSIVDFGAQGGGQIKNTGAINKAIKQLSQTGGGTVIIPSGKWLTGPIVMHSNINLHLDEGAELLFSQDFADYLPAVITNWEGSEVFAYTPFIYAFEQENIAITGKGVLNGQGKPWWEQRRKNNFKNSRIIQEMNENEVPVDERRFDNLDHFLPPVFFGPLYCKNILIEGVSFEYGAFWTINPSFCDNVIVRGIYIVTNGEYGDTPNGDGINPNSCSNVLIEYNKLDTGDDCITIKSGRNKDGRRLGVPCKNILIRYNTGFQGHGGIVIGSEMSGGVENLYAHDCKFYGTDRALRIKTARGRGGYVKNCWFKNIEADTIEREAIRINMMYTGGDRLPVQVVDASTPVIENLHYENISCDYSKRNVIQIIGIPEMPVKNVSFKNMHLKGKSGIEVRDAIDITMEHIFISNEEDEAINLSYSDSIIIDHVEIKNTVDDENPIYIENLTNSEITNIKHDCEEELFIKAGSNENVIITEYLPENKTKKNE